MGRGGMGRSHQLGDAPRALPETAALMSADTLSATSPAEQAAWLAFVPAAIVTSLALVLLGPPLGHLLFPDPHLAFWPERRVLVHPEATELARYVVALSAPLVLIALTALWLRRRPRGADPRLARAAELTGLALLIGCFVAQWTYVYHDQPESSIVIRYFDARTLLVAAAIAVAIVAAIRSPRVRALWTTWTGGTRGPRAAAWAAAVVAIAITLLPAIQTDAGIGAGNIWLIFHLQFPFDETMAVVDGRSPLGDFAAQYASLWPYLLAAGMSLFGVLLTTFTVQMTLLTGVTMLALFDVLRRVVRSAAAALALFLPLLATSAFTLIDSGVDRGSLVNYFGTLPLRYAGPFLLAWLLARHLDGARPRRTSLLFLVGGLVAWNNAEQGVSALAATAAALVVVRAARGRALAREAGVGLAAASALVVLLLLLRTGSVPDPSLLVRYARVFAGGLLLQPIRPVVGMSTVLLLTYVGAIGVAFARAREERPDRLLTALLMWSGVFGLGAGIYYAGQSGPEKLPQMFPAWALAVTLLTVVAVRRLASRPRGLPTPIRGGVPLRLRPARLLAGADVPSVGADRPHRPTRPVVQLRSAGGRSVRRQSDPPGRAGPDPDPLGPCHRPRSRGGGRRTVYRRPLHPDGGTARRQRPGAARGRRAQALSRAGDDLPQPAQSAARHLRLRRREGRTRHHLRVVDPPLRRPASAVRRAPARGWARSTRRAARTPCGPTGRPRRGCGRSSRCGRSPRRAAAEAAR